MALVPKFLSAGLVVLIGMSMLAAHAPAQFHGAKEPYQVDASQSTQHVITTAAGKITCKTVTATDLYVPFKTWSWLDLSPSYSGCTAFFFTNVPIHANGCVYEILSLSFMELKCPAGKAIEITVPGCTTRIEPPQLWVATRSNNATKTDITLSTNETNVPYNECGTKRSDGTYTGTTTLTGTDAFGQSMAIWFE